MRLSRIVPFASLLTMNRGSRSEAVRTLVGAAWSWTLVGSVVSALLNGLVVVPFAFEAPRPMSEVPSFVIAGLLMPVAIFLLALPVSLLVFVVLGAAGVVAGLSRSWRVGVASLLAFLAASLIYVDVSGASRHYGEVDELSPELVRWAFLEHTLLVVLAPLLFWSGREDLHRLGVLDVFKP